MCRKISNPSVIIVVLMMLAILDNSTNSVSAEANTSLSSRLNNSNGTASSASTSLFRTNSSPAKITTSQGEST